MGSIDHLWQAIGEKLGQGAALIVVPILGAIAWIAASYFWTILQQAWCFVQSRRRALGAVARQVSKDGACEGQGVWLTEPVDQPESYKNLIESARVLSIANLKGGVGKTTLTANLGAYFAKEWGKRVLLVDLDFQGSLSSMAFPSERDWIPRRGQSSIAAKLISNDITPDLISSVARDVPLHENGHGSGCLKVITAYYDLAQADNRILIEWLLQCRRKIPKTVRHMLSELLVGKLFRTLDVRYTLAEILNSAAVREAFQLIIIDCPPRLTTSEMQAFCASSHILIPTILDRPSAEAVSSLCGQVETLKKAAICPHLQYIGVVGTMLKPNVNYDAAKGLVQAALQGANIPAGILLADTFIPHTNEIVKEADEGIAYLVMGNAQRHQKVRKAIEALARRVAGQMGLPEPPNFQPLALPEDQGAQK